MKQAGNFTNYILFPKKFMEQALDSINYNTIFNFQMNYLQYTWQMPAAAVATLQSLSYSEEKEKNNINIKYIN